MIRSTISSSPRRRQGIATTTERKLPPDRPARGEPLGAFFRRHYGPHSAQQAFLNDKSRYRAAVAGIGGGKSEAGACDAVRHCIRFPGIKGLVVAPSFRMLERSTARVLRKVIGWWGSQLEVEVFKQENRLVFPGLRDDNGEPSEILFGHAQDPDSLRGGEVGFFWIDEAALCKEDTWRVCLGRTRQPGVPHRGWITTTPKGQNWVYRQFVGDRETWPAARQARRGFHTWATHANPLYLTDPEYLEALEEDYGKGTSFYDQELLALFVSMSGLVYRPFATWTQALPQLVRIVGGIDWGVTAPGCMLVAGVTDTGLVLVLDEVFERGKVISNSPGEDWLTTCRDLTSRWGVVQWFADPEDANAILTLQRAKLPVVAANNKRLDGVRAVQALVAGGKLAVLENAAPNLIAERGQYAWRTDSEGRALEDADPAKGFDHALDPLRYLVMGVIGGLRTQRTIRLAQRRSLA